MNILDILLFLNICKFFYQKIEVLNILSNICNQMYNKMSKRLTIIRPSQKTDNEKVVEKKELDICPHCHSNSLVTLRYGRFQKIGAVFCSKCHKDKDYKSDDEVDVAENYGSDAEYDDTYKYEIN
jgi:hypothetical protein